MVKMLAFAIVRRNGENNAIQPQIIYTYNLYLINKRSTVVVLLCSNIKKYWIFSIDCGIVMYVTSFSSISY